MCLEFPERGQKEATNKKLHGRQGTLLPARGPASQRLEWTTDPELNAVLGHGCPKEGITAAPNTGMGVGGLGREYSVKGTSLSPVLLTAGCEVLTSHSCGNVVISVNQPPPPRPALCTQGHSPPCMQPPVSSCPA